MFTAGFWNLTGYGLSQVIRFASNLIMTRLLEPKMFGIMGIVSVILAGLTLFSDLGLEVNIVQSRRGHDAAFLNTAWVVQIIRGGALWLVALVICAILFLAQHLALVPHGSVYAEPVLPFVLATNSSTAVIQGFESTKSSQAIRNLLIFRVTLNRVISQIVALACMLGWAWYDPSIWALVYGSMIGSALNTVLSHVALPGVANRWQWDSRAFWEIFHFGKWIFLSSIVGFFAINGDRLLIGGLVDPTTFGVYVIAFTVFSAVEQVLSRVIAGVTFPAISEIARDRRNELKHQYYRIIAVVASASYVCAGILMTAGQPLINSVYNYHYQQAGWMLQVLAACLITAPFMVPVQCFLALGRPSWTVWISGLRCAVLFACLPLGFHLFGLLGALCGILGSRFLCLPLIVFYGSKLELFDFRKELTFIPGLFIGLALGKLMAMVLGMLAG